MREENPMTEPANWLGVIENIRAVRRRFPAPVDTMGCDQVSSKTEQTTTNQRFQVLTSLMLSSQTKDPITWAAVQKLKEHGLGNVDGILGAKEKDIEDLIYPVGFYRRKAIYLKKVATILKQQYDGDIPGTIEDLCSLPGVGPKMAHLCMKEAWKIITGIGVDTHVHRISARLGWVPSKGIKTPEDTRKALESWLPKEYWPEINHLLVGFGQTICTPLRPKCDQCYNQVLCPYYRLNTVGGKPKKEVKKETTSPKAKVQGKKEKPPPKAKAKAAVEMEKSPPKTRSRVKKESSLPPVDVKVEVKKERSAPVAKTEISPPGEDIKVENKKSPPEVRIKIERTF